MEQPEYHAWRKHFIAARGRPPTAYEAWVAAQDAMRRANPTLTPTSPIPARRT